MLQPTLITSEINFNVISFFLAVPNAVATYFRIAADIFKRRFRRICVPLFTLLCARRRSPSSCIVNVVVLGALCTHGRTEYRIVRLCLPAPRRANLIRTNPRLREQLSLFSARVAWRTVSACNDKRYSAGANRATLTAARVIRF